MLSLSPYDGGRRLATGSQKLAVPSGAAGASAICDHPRHESDLKAVCALVAAASVSACSADSTQENAPQLYFKWNDTLVQQLTTLNQDCAPTETVTQTCIQDIDVVAGTLGDIRADVEAVQASDSKYADLLRALNRADSERDRVTQLDCGFRFSLDCTFEVKYYGADCSDVIREMARLVTADS